MPKPKEFEDGRRRIAAQLEDITKTLDQIQIQPKPCTDSKDYTEADMLVFVKQSENRHQQLLGMRHFRRELCEDHNPHVQKIIDMGLVPFFVEGLKADDCQMLQLEAAWALTNVSAGSSDETRVVIENGALPLLVQFTEKTNVDLKEQALWAIGNIAAEKSFLKALVEKGALNSVLTILENEKGVIRLARIAIWALANFCRYGAETIKTTSDYIPRTAVVLSACMQHTDRQVVNDAAWGVASFTTPEWLSNAKELLVQNGILTHLVDAILYSDNAALHYPVLKGCAQILSGPESYAVEFLCHETILPKLKKLLTNRTNRKTMSNILWLIQNIAANRFRVSSKLFKPQIIPRVIELVIYGPHEIKIEAGSVLNNLFHVGDIPVQALDTLVGWDAIRALCALLMCDGNKTIIDTMTALERVLVEGGKLNSQKHQNLSGVDETYCMIPNSKKDKKRYRAIHHASGRFNAVAQRIINAGGKKTLILLADHEDKGIRSLAIKLLTQFLDGQDFDYQESSEEEYDPEGMLDVNGGSLEDDSSVASVENKDEMALCDDVKNCSIWGQQG